LADITMPQLGETVTEGTITRWLKQVGDEVALDEPLFEVSTDKVDSEVPSPSAGIVTEILVKEGETVDVGARLAVLSASAAPSSTPQRPAEVPVAQAPPPPPPPPPRPEPQAPPIAVTPAPKVEEPVVTTASPGPSQGGESPNGSGTRGALLSPVVRRLIAENGIDPAVIPGTGLGGRITRDDVLGYLDVRATSKPSQTAVAVSTQVPSSSPAYSAPHPAGLSVPPSPLGVRDEVIPFGAIRRVTAEHMVRSIATSAHALVAMETDFENVDRVRREFKDRFVAEEGVSLSYLPFVARAVIDVLHKYPHLNASVGDDALIVHHDIHLGIAVDLALEGLIVPVVHNADGQSLRGLARSIADLASRARSRKLSADDISGGTFTITNPGPFGTFITVPIIAQPQVAILSTDGVTRKPVVVSVDGMESIAIHSVGTLALSFDHRAVDGAYAAAFLKDVAVIIATRDWKAEF
jgi:2-oxoglutarate dehydrogenase E2 component (dihydrolipoamide succinyltransferase)